MTVNPTPPPYPRGELRIKYASAVALLVMAAVFVGIYEGGKYFYDKETAAPQLALPTQVKGAVGEIIPITATGSATDLRWHSLDKNLFIAPRKLVNDPHTILVSSPVAGTYAVSVHGSLHSQSTDIVSTQVVVGTQPLPPPGPGPGPNPPGPNPPGPTPPPTPTPVPIPGDGLHVLVVYDPDKLSAMTDDQRAILYGADVRTYLNSKGTDVWRIWKSTVDASNEAPLWKDAFSRKRDSLPWIVVSNGKTGFEGPLPANVASTLTLLKTYGN